MVVRTRTVVRIARLEGKQTGIAARTQVARAAVEAVREARVDHVVVTGALTNLALPSEFAPFPNMTRAPRTCLNLTLRVTENGRTDARTKGRCG